MGKQEKASAAVRIERKIAGASRVRSVAAPNESPIGKLARSISAYATHDGFFDSRIPGSHGSRYSQMNAECGHAPGEPHVLMPQLRGMCDFLLFDQEN